MDVADVLAFWAVSFVFVVAPGSDWAYAISAGLRGRVALPAVGGMLAGHLAATVLVAAGVGALVAGAPGLLGALTLVGGAYLLWLGFQTFTRSAPPQESIDAATGSSRARWLWKGFGVSGLNPKVLLLILALLPQFTSTSAPWPVWAQVAVLGLVHLATCAAVYLTVAVTAQRVLSARPGAARVVSRTSAVVMTGLGVALIVEQALV
ncbi:LysE family translocator [Cellulomonas xylanilytica]|uniref:Lysine transporter LysE n=1 Tax=Cellulomonas xylanilytica TaxID=233583 RepID=A0A510V4N2_9CELL|nr:LysE family translocator [Cellulomonas xylanilytica]GEK21766.1 lysine transporter LysE [Cellulomonas xylanilytica]